VTDPAAMPPPSTRSSSSCPLPSRVSAAASSLSRVRGATRGRDAPLVLERAGAARCSSEFHAEQCGHCPCHLSVSPAHSEQMKTGLDRAMAPLYVRESQTREMRELLHTPRIGLRFAHCAADDGFVNAHSDLSRGNASVEGLKSGWGEGLSLKSCVVISCIQCVACERRRCGVRVVVPVIPLTLCRRPHRPRGAG
jgi:hypothetical protein